MCGRKFVTTGWPRVSTRIKASAKPRLIGDTRGRSGSQETRRLPQAPVRQPEDPRGAAAEEGRFGGGLYWRGVHGGAVRRRRGRRPLVPVPDGDSGGGSGRSGVTPCPGRGAAF